MAIVDQGYAAWLKSEALYSTATDPRIAAAWGDKAIDSEYISPLAMKADADIEAQQQLNFLSAPTAKDEHVIAGLHADLVGQMIALQGDRYGYETAPSVFVLRAVENETADTTTITVLYWMPECVRARPLTLPFFEFTSRDLPPGATLKRASVGVAYNATNRLQTFAIDAPRFDQDPVTNKFRGLVIEPASANILSASEDFSAAAWGGAASVTADSDLAPTRQQTADTVSDTSTTAVQDRNRSIAIPPNSLVTWSIFDKMIAGYPAMRMVFTGGTGSGALEAILDPANGVGMWRAGSPGLIRFEPAPLGFFRALVTVQDTGANTALSLQFRPAYASTYTVAPDLAATGSQILFGAQAEIGPGSSYISSPTANTQRAADILTLNWEAHGLPDGAYTFRVRFDDESVQDFTMTVAGGVSVLPTTLSRSRILRVELLR